MRNVIVLVLVMATAAMAGNAGGPNSTPRILDNVIFQDFENPSGWDGTNPPAGWTILDNGQTDGTWDSFDWSKYTGWGSGTARVNGGSSYRYNNDWIITPAVDFSGATSCQLFFRQFYDDYLTQAADSALVLISNDNGETWNTLAVYKESDFGSDTVPDSVTIDISTYASGHSQVKVAFQYLKLEAVVAGSWRIDDVKLIADATPILNENFESNWAGNNPPSGWAILDVHVAKWDDNDWHQANIEGWGNVARVYWSPVEQQNEFLISPSMDFSDPTNSLQLTLKQWYEDAADTRDSAFILGSINGGSTWPETLAVYRSASRGSLANAAYDTFDILDWANNQADVKIGFKYVGNNDGRWYIDSVNVERIDMFANDVKVDSIITPPQTTIAGYSWPVSAIVENVGINTNTFDVVMQIYDSTGFMVYNNTQTVTSLPMLAQRTVNFANWIAGESNAHSIKCFTQMFIDLDHSNDTLQTSTLTYPHTGQGGPAGGWSFADNITGESPPYFWINIRSTGTEISFSDADDGNSGMIDMGMDFNYFGEAYTRIAVSTDGWLSFEDSTGTDSSPSAIPNADGPSAMVALLWGDLNLGTGHVYYQHQMPTDIFIVQFDSVEFAAIPGSKICAEVVFDGNDNSITMLYNHISHFMSDVAVGLENQTQDLGLAYDNNGEIGQTPLAGLAIYYTYLPPHDIRALSIIQPRGLLVNGNTYSIVAKVRNVGANMESFEVTASDDHIYSNTQLVVDLPSLDTATVIFPGWSINSECETYTLRVISNLGEDLNRSNDTVLVEMVSSPAGNKTYIYDDGAPYIQPLSLGDTTDVIATEFSSSYENTAISAIAYKFYNLDENPNHTGPDTFIASIYIDSNEDGTPDAQPIYSRVKVAAHTGWTIWNIGCDTNLVVDCKNIWAGFSVVESISAWIDIDQTFDYPAARWARESRQWHRLPGAFGDFMIRASMQADTTTHPELSPESRHIIGATQPEGIDTVSSYIENTGTDCPLNYQVSLVQSSSPLLLSHGNSINSDVAAGNPIILGGKKNDTGSRPPHLLDSGGPDAYGYTWKDSDEPGGPSGSWIDITPTGTLVTWTHGNSDDGYTDPIPMGMTFNFYGDNFSSVVISTNGWVSFMPLAEEDGFARSSNEAIPNHSFNTLLAVEWDNLTGGSSGHCYYNYDPYANIFVIAWLGWSYVPGGGGTHDFEVILEGATGNIIYQYGLGTYESDITVGIQNAACNDGLEVICDQPYLHGSMAVQFKPPIYWLSTDLASAVLPSGSGQLTYKVFMNSTGLPSGIYSGAINLFSTDTHEPLTTIDVQFQIEGVCSYVPGDVNGSGAATGQDVVYMVGFFHGGRSPHEECPQCVDAGYNMLWPQGDVNGNCSWTGQDVTYFVRRLKGMGPALRFCPQCPPAGGR